MKEETIKNVNEEEEKSFFSSQQEIWKYLVEEEGRKVISKAKYNQDVLGFFNKRLFNFTQDFISSVFFEYPEQWKPYVEKPWYENIPEQGVLCWIGDEESCVLNKKSADIVTRYLGGSYPFLIRQGSTYKFAIPLTKEEVENLTWKEKE